MRVNKLGNHLSIFWNQRLWVDNPELLNLHNRLSIKSLIFVDDTPKLPVVNTYSFIYVVGVLQ